MQRKVQVVVTSSGWDFYPVHDLCINVDSETCIYSWSIVLEHSSLLSGDKALSLLLPSEGHVPDCFPCSDCSRHLSTLVSVFYFFHPNRIFPIGRAIKVGIQPKFGQDFSFPLSWCCLLSWPKFETRAKIKIFTGQNLDSHSCKVWLSKSCSPIYSLIGKWLIHWVPIVL